MYILRASRISKEGLDQIEKQYIYATAANGLEVRIPADKYPQWRKAQEELKSGARKEEPQMVKRLASLMAKR